MTKKIEAFYLVIESARHFMNQMNEVSAEIHKKIGINSGSRGVLLLLNEFGSLASPQLAREMAVSRQYLQKTINMMEKRGLVELKENPAHKKSSLVTLTVLGERTLASLLKAEAELINSREITLDPDSLEVTSKTLRQLADSFNEK
jgi:DNA-binding MarR family transcriptional regulator